MQILDEKFFFYNLDRLGLSVTIDAICGEVRIKLALHLQEILPPSSPRLFWKETSILSSKTVSSPPKVIRPLTRKERLRLATIEVNCHAKPMVETANAFDVNGSTLHDRVYQKRRSAIYSG